MALDFQENLAPVESGDRWGYINPNGTFAINPQFDSAYEFKDGLAMVVLNKQLGYINASGKFVLHPRQPKVLLLTPMPLPGQPRFRGQVLPAVRLVD